MLMARLIDSTTGPSSLNERPPQAQPRRRARSQSYLAEATKRWSPSASVRASFYVCIHTCLLGCTAPQLLVSTEDAVVSMEEAGPQAPQTDTESPDAGAAKPDAPADQSAAQDAASGMTMPGEGMGSAGGQAQPTWEERCVGHRDQWICDEEGRMRRCDPNGVPVGDEQYCGSMERCETGQLSGRCPICKPGQEYRCQGAELLICSGNGTTFVHAYDCVSAAVCDAEEGACKPVVCPPEEVSAKAEWSLPATPTVQA